MSKFLTTNDLADRWRTTVNALKKQRATNRGPKYVKVGTRVLYPLEEVEKLEKLFGGPKDD